LVTSWRPMQGRNRGGRIGDIGLKASTGYAPVGRKTPARRQNGGKGGDVEEKEPRGEKKLAVLLRTSTGRGNGGKEDSAIRKGNPSPTFLERAIETGRNIIEGGPPENIAQA